MSPRERMERVKGIEPSSSAWKAIARPLSYTRPKRLSLLAYIQRTRSLIRCSSYSSNKWWGELDLNQRRLSQRIYSPPPLTARASPLRNPQKWVSPPIPSNQSLRNSHSQNTVSGCNPKTSIMLQNPREPVPKSVSVNQCALCPLRPAL